MDDPGESKPQNKADLMMRIHTAWDALMESIQLLNREEMTLPGPEKWSVKDHLAHVTLWEKVLLYRHLQKRSFAEAVSVDEEKSRELAKIPAEGGINEFFYERQKERSLDETLAELHGIHAALIQQLESMEYEDFLKPRRPGAEELLLESISDNSFGHYEEHLQIIRSLTAG